MSECSSVRNTDLTFYQKKKDVVLSKGKDYKNNKDRLREQAKYKYRNLSEEEKNKKENKQEINIKKENM